MSKREARLRRKKRMRAKIFGTSKRPRLSVFRSSRYIYAQIIDDEKKETLLSVSDHSLGLDKEKKMKKIEKARLIGQYLAQLAIKRKISKVVFDRGGRKYHGRIKALAEGAREKGLKF